MKDRVELLGHTLANCRREFDFLAELNGFDSDKFTFEALQQALATIDVASLSLDYGSGEEDFGEFFREQVYPRLGRKLQANDTRDLLYSAAGNGEPKQLHRVAIAGGQPGCDRPAGHMGIQGLRGIWLGEIRRIRPHAWPSYRFLIVTEGSSDAAILRHGPKLLRPHIAEFFDFVDMKEGYPFTGTGNLTNFTKGLISIAVQNNVIVLFDIDAEGCYNFDRCCQLNVPANMRILKLPDLPEFESSDTVGPSGHHRLDINGRAAAMELPTA